MAMIHFGKRARLLSGCAMAVAMSGQAYAQAYPDRALQGDIIGTPAGVSINRSPTLDTITISAPQAIINWNPETSSGQLPPGPIEFLGQNGTASFVGATDFIVLNRILPSDNTRPIVINGIVNSLVNGQQGGSVWFYTPGGIIAGANAQFNVGNLVLTANDIDASDGLVDSNGAIRFRGITGSNAAVEIQNGAKINLLNNGSYLAVVAPRVIMAGDAVVNGSAAYVAGEAVDVRIDSGLFDINFQTGGGTSASGDVVSHTGTTTSQNGDFGGNGMFFAAMPKNQAISMLLGGTVGYTPASSASVDNGVIVLSAGGNVSSGVAQFDPAAAPLANILIGAGNYTSAVRAAATGTITLKPDIGSSANFDGNVFLRGLNLLADADTASILIGGALELNASGPLQGGVARLTASNGGSIDVNGGDITLYADGSSYNQPSIGEDAKGGTASIQIDNGRISTAGNLILSAYGYGGYGADAGGKGEGGLVTVNVANAGSLNGLYANTISLKASGFGGEIGYGDNPEGGAGQGGTIRANFEAAEVRTSAFIAEAEGLASEGGYGGNGGNGVGGTIELSFKEMSASITDLNASASARGGSSYGNSVDGGNGGTAQGGTINLLLDNAQMFGSNLNFRAQGNGTSDDGFASGGSGGAATGGTITLGVVNNATLGYDLAINASARGGNTDFLYDEDDQDHVADAFGAAGSATGGTINLNVNQGTIDAPNTIDLLTYATGGTGPIGGDAQGGTILIDIPNGTVNPSTSTRFLADATAQAGSTGLRDASPRVDSARSGNATGGDITFNLGTAETSAALTATLVTLDASVAADPMGNRDTGEQGLARGGSVTATLANGTINASGSLRLDATAQGGSARSNYGGGMVATGGTGIGGTASLSAVDSFISSNKIDVLATGDGGSGDGNTDNEFQQSRLSANGGNGEGGTASLIVTRGSISGPILVDASASGGNGATGIGADGASGGSATGGDASVALDSTQVDGTILLFGRALGGSGGDSQACDGCETVVAFGAGHGGNALSKLVRLDITAVSTAINSISVSSVAQGGTGGIVSSFNYGLEPGEVGGGQGGNATSGGVGVNLTTIDTSLSDIAIDTNAFGGMGGGGQFGGRGGNATAGNLDLQLFGGSAAPSSLMLTARAAAGGGGLSAFGTGGFGGNAQAGMIGVRTEGTLVMPNDATFSANAQGGGGGGSTLDGGNGGDGGTARSGAIRLVAIAANGLIDSSNTTGIYFNLLASGGDAADGNVGGSDGQAGGSGGNGGAAYGGVLSLTASDGAQIALPQFDYDLRTLGGDGGRGGEGGFGADGITGAAGAIGENGSRGGMGGTGGIGGNGGVGGNVIGGEFAVSASNGAVVTLGDLDLDLFARSGFAGRGGRGGIGGVGGLGGAGGDGSDDGNGNIVNPGDGGQGGQGGTGGVGGDGGQGSQAIGGIFTLNAENGTITTGLLTVRANALGSFGGEGGSAGEGGYGGDGGEGGYGTQGTPGLRGSYGGSGDYGDCGFGNLVCRSGSGGLAQGGYIGLTASTFGETPGSLTTGFAQLDGSAFLNNGEGSTESGLQGEIHLTANGTGTVFSMNQLTAYSGGFAESATGGLIEISGNGATLDLGNTLLTTSGQISLLMTGTGSILSGTDFEARTFAIRTQHDGLLSDGATVRADRILINADNSIDTISGRLWGRDYVELHAGWLIDIGSTRVTGGSVMNSGGGAGPVGAEIKATVGLSPFHNYGPLPGDLTAYGLLEADGSIRLSADNNLRVAGGAELYGNNRVHLYAGGDVVVDAGANVTAGINPISESGYGSGPFSINGQLDIQAGRSMLGYSIAPGDISSVRIAGNLEAGDGAISLSGAAIDGTGSSMSAQYIRANIFGATNGGSDDLGTLNPGCTEGLICLGTVNARSTLQIGTLGAPLTASIAGPTSVADLDIAAIGDITFGDGLNAVTIEGYNSFNARSTNGNILLNGPVTLAGGATFSLTAGGAITGSQGRVTATGDLILGAPGGVSLQDLLAGNKLLFAQESGPPVELGDFTGVFDISGLLQLGSGDLILNSDNGFNFGQISLADGAVVSLTSSSGDVTVGSIGNSPFGTPASITVNAGGAVVLTHAETSGNLLVNGASFATGLNSIITGGDIDINVAGLADLGNSSAGGHADVTAGSIAFNSLTTGDYTTLTASGTITGNTLDSGAATTISGDDGAMFGTLLSAGAVSLSAVNGMASVNQQLVAPTIDVSAQSIVLNSDQAVIAPNLTATSGTLSVNAASFSGSNASASAGISVIAAGGIALANLNAGSGSSLIATNGAILVSNNVSAPALDVFGRSVTLRATGALSNLGGQATAGAFDSRAGTTITGSAIQASTNATLIAPGGITVTGLVSDTTTLSATNGSINVTGVVTNGLTATARDVYLRGGGTLNATSLTSSAGGIDVQSVGNLTVGSANANTLLTLGSVTGSLGFTSLTAGTTAALSAATTVNGGSLNSSSATIGGLNGVTLAGLTTSGTAALFATNGAINVTGVNAGNITATARSITLQSPTLLNASQLTATAGNLDVRGALLNLGTVSATGTLFGQAFQGGITFGSAQAGGNATLTAASTVNGTTLTSGGNTSVTGPGGITIATSTSTGTGNYSASGGAINIGTNVSASSLTANAQSIRLRATGALNINTAQATGGNLDVQATGAIGIGTGTANAQLIVNSTGGTLGFGSLSAGGAATLSAAAAITGTSLTSGTNATVTGVTGIDIGTVSTGASGLASLTANNGAVRVAGSLTTAQVQAQGLSVYLRSTSTLNASLLRAIAGDIDVQSNALTATTVQSSGNTLLRTTSGVLNFTTLTAGAAATLNAGSTLTGNALSAANATLTAPGNINVASLSGGAVNIASINGNVNVGTDLRASSGAISGRAVTLRSLAGLTLTSAQASAGALDVRAAGALTVGNASATTTLSLVSDNGALGFTTANAATNATLTAATTITGGSLTASNATLTAPLGITLTGLNVGGVSQLTAVNGLVDVSGLVGSNVLVNASAIRLAGSGDLTASSLTATGGALTLNFGGDISLGSASAATTLDITAADAFTFASLTSGGNATLGANTVSGGTLSSGDTVGITTTGDITLTGLSAANTASLTASNGLIDVSGLDVGDIVATGLGINLSATGDLMASSLTATSANLVLSGNRLALGTATANGSIDGTASDNDISFGALTSGGTTTLNAATLIAGGTIDASSSVSLTAPDGITLSGLTVGGSSQLSAANGTVDVSNLVGSGISVDASSIRLSGAGNFDASSLNATGGLLDLNFGGAITLGDASAATTLDLVSGGALAFANLNSGGNTTLRGSNVSGGGLFSGGAANVFTIGGILLSGLSAANGATLTATGGNVDVTGLDASTVIASGRGISLTTNRSVLNAGTLSAGGGDITLSGTALFLTGASATGAINGTASDGDIRFTSLISGGATTLDAATIIFGGTIDAGDGANLTAPGGITLTGLDVGGVSQLTAVNGLVDVSGLVGSNISVTADAIRLSGTGDFSADDLTAGGGSIELDFGGNVSLRGSTAAATTLDIMSGGTLDFIQLISGGDLTLTASSVAGGNLLGGAAVGVTAPNGITIANLNSNSLSQLSAVNGAIDIAEVGYGAVGALARNVSVASSGDLIGTTLTATAGNLTLRGTSIDLDTGNASGAINGVATDSDIRFNRLTSGGATTLNAATSIIGGSITAGDGAILSAPGGIMLTGLGGNGVSRLTSTGGLVDVSGLTSVSFVDVDAQGIRLGGTNLTSNTLIARAGALSLNFTGPIVLRDATASTTLDIVGGGTLGFTRLASGGNLTVNAASIFGGDIAGGGAVSATAPGGITIGNLASTSGSTLLASNGNINVTDISAGTMGATARDITIVSTGNLRGTTLTATAGNLSLRGGSMSINAGSATGFVDARTSSGGISFGTLAGGGDTTMFSATNVTGTTLTSAGATRITAPGGIDIANLRGTGAVALTAAAGAIRVSNNLTAATLTASGTSLFLRSLGGLNATSLTATGGAIDIGLTGALTFGTIASTGATAINAGSTVTGTTLTSGGTTTINAPSGITIDTLRSTGAATLTAANGPIRVNTEIAGNNIIANGTSIFLRNPGALTLGQVLSTTGDVDILAGGNLTITSASAANALTLGSGGNLSVGSIGNAQLTPNTVALTSTGSTTLGDVTARGAFSLSAGTSANLNGVMVAPTIAIRSADIAVASTARVGSVGTTTQLTLTSIAGSTTIGGSSTGTGYRLSEAEAQRLSANNILIATQRVSQGQDAIDPNAVPELTLDTLNLSATAPQQGFANLSANGTLRFQTQGTMRVIGALRLTGAGTTNRIELAAGPAIQVRPGGSAALVNGSDLAGTLVLTAADIIASDANTLSGLASAADAKTQGDLLGLNPNATDDMGYFAANAIQANVSHGFYVQNSGLTQATGARTYDQRRGLTVGNGGLTVTPTGQVPITIAVNGRQLSATTGNFVTGTAFPPLVNFGSDSSLIVSGSTINGCVIGLTCSSSLGTIDPGVVARDTIAASDLIESALDAATNAINVPDVLVELPGFNALVGQPLIEDPVTGSGNDDLLADKDGKQCDPSVETCTKE